jgi:hypothetical protein
VLWAVSPDNKYTKLGQVVNTGKRNEAEIKSETTLTDFGLLVTLQPEGESPAGDVVPVFYERGEPRETSSQVGGQEYFFDPRQLREPRLTPP